MDTKNAFTVTPMSHNIDLVAGKTYEGSFTIANPASATQDFNYRIDVSPYSVSGEDYAADFVTESTRSQIVDWVKIDEPTGVLKPNETKKIAFKIKVPETAPAGGQYAAFLISSNDDTVSSDSLMVSSVFEIASIIYANVEGETVHAGEMKEISIPGFVTTSPIKVDAILTNDGNTHETAEIGLEVKSAFSAQPIYPQPGESSAIVEVIMPGTSRYVSRDITGISPLGVYEVTQTINYLGENYQVRQTVVACPIWFLILVVFAIVSIILAIVSIFKKRRLKRKVF